MHTAKNYWHNLSEKIEKPEQTYNKRSDVSEDDALFISRFLTPDTSLLDFGSGTGKVINQLINKVKDITAVETYKGFTNFIVNAENMLVINARLEGFKICKSFDVITATAVMQYFPEETAVDIYQNIYDMLKPGGVFIARNHVGLHENIAVSKSDELDSEYFAEYRLLEAEINNIKLVGFFVEVIDAVPSHHNAWENSKHLYFVCRK